MDRSSELFQSIKKDLSFLNDDQAQSFEASLIIEFLDTHNGVELKDILSARKTNKPLAYIFGEWEFLGLNLKVNENVLIPRQETEFVVDEFLTKCSFALNDELKILDIGTGSGAIAIYLAKHFRNSRVLASDISLTAIEIAKENASKHALSNIDFVHSDLFENIDEENQFDVIISNPPYIGEDEAKDLDSSVLNFEPHNALFANDDGFEIYRKIIEQSVAYLKPDSYLVFEIAPRHENKIKECSNKNSFVEIEVLKDLNGRGRLAIARKPIN